VVEKRGSFYTVGEAKIGQGRENAKQYLKDNPDLAEEIELAVRQRAGATAMVGAVAEAMEVDAAA
jgi:recombination protein RecA